MSGPDRGTTVTDTPPAPIKLAGPHLLGAVVVKTLDQGRTAFQLLTTTAFY
jgi:hypothetical protein